MSGMRSSEETYQKGRKSYDTDTGRAACDRISVSGRPRDTESPLEGTFELTPVCNMDCRMCYVKMSRQQQEAIRPLMTAEEWIRLAEEAKEQGTALSPSYRRRAVQPSGLSGDRRTDCMIWGLYSPLIPTERMIDRKDHGVAGSGSSGPDQYHPVRGLRRHL